MTFPNGQNSPVSHRWDNLCEWASSRVILKHASLGSLKALTAHPHSQQAPLCLKSAVVLERKHHIAPQRAPQPPVVPPNHCFFFPSPFPSMDISAFPEGAEDLVQHFYPLAITFDHHISSDVPLALSSYAALQFLPFP